MCIYVQIVKFIKEFFCLHSTCLLQVDGLAGVIMDMVLYDLVFEMMNVLASIRHVTHSIQRSFVYLKTFSMLIMC